MRLYWFPGIASIFLIAAAQPPHENRRMFLDRVEKNVRLPAGARPLKAYFRSYFSAQDGAKIMGGLVFCQRLGAC